MPARASLLAELLLRERTWTPGDAGPLNRSLYELVKREILDGALSAGTRLPPSRALGAELGVSRNTVLHAYEQLLAEGYVTAGVGRGTFVADIARPPQRAAARAAAGTAPVALSRRGRRLLERGGASDRQWGAFVAGVPDVSLFPHDVWARLLARHWRRPAPEALSYSTGAGHPALRRALAEHLRLARSVQCDADQVLVTAGIHQAVDLVSRLLGDVGDRAWLEDPGYWGTRSLLENNGIEVVPVPVDAHGMAPTPALLRGPPPRFIVTTPSHHYPLGTVMSLPRRLALLEHAHATGAWIVEDDYDSEFRFEGRPLASLQGLDTRERVVYVGTFSKTLFPGLRTGYMVLPRALAGPAQQALSELYREGQLVQQAALADFMAQGHYAAHIRRMRPVYARRHTLLREAIERRLGPHWPVASREAGLHLVLSLPDGADDVAVSAELRRLGVHTRALSRYHADPAHARRGLLLGYACVDDDAIDAGVRTMAGAILGGLAPASLPARGRQRAARR